MGLFGVYWWHLRGNKMKFYGQAEQAANRILELFCNPELLPKAIAPIFIRRKDHVPCREWSWSNQILTALAGTSDARGFRQWQQVNRQVNKGSKAFYILAPISKKITPQEPDSDEKIFVVGFKSVPVFKIEDTSGDELPIDSHVQQFLNELPLLNVAHRWGLRVEAYNGQSAGALGWYRSGSGIALGVENLSTWCHELIHAADDKLGTLGNSAKLNREIVAELGGAVLLQCIGKPVESDLGGAWDYIESWCSSTKIHPLSACQKLLKRVCDCVALVLDSAQDMEQVQKIAA